MCALVSVSVPTSASYRNMIGLTVGSIGTVCMFACVHLHVSMSLLTLYHDIIVPIYYISCISRPLNTIGQNSVQKGIFESYAALMIFYLTLSTKVCI